MTRRPPAHAITIVDNGDVDESDYQSYCVCGWSGHTYARRHSAFMEGEEHLKAMSPSTGWIEDPGVAGEIAQEVTPP